MYTKGGLQISIMKFQHEFSRTELLIGEENLNKLKKSKVAVLGIGGVGGYAVEALVRGAVGNIIMADDDTVCLTNLNRQIQALYSTIAKPKVEVMKNRILDINKDCSVKIYQKFITKENLPEIIDKDTDYVIDAMDTITAKIDTILWCQKNNIKIISCMGVGNKFDPTRFKIGDIYETKICPLAKIMRHELRKRGVESLKVLYSDEVPTKPRIGEVLTCKEACICKNGSKKCALKGQIPASNSFVPPVAGFIIAGEVIKSLIGFNN